MAKDELTRPLGLTPRAKLSPARRLAAGVAIALVVAGALAGGGFWLLRTSSSAGPTATVTIAAATAKLPDTSLPAASVPPKAAPAPCRRRFPVPAWRR